MARGKEKVVVPREDLPPLSKLSDGSYGHIVRYRVVSEDQNRFSHWSPIRELLVPTPRQVSGDLAIVGSNASLVWDKEGANFFYDIFLNSQLVIDTVEINNNIATVSVLGNHNLSAGTDV